METGWKPMPVIIKIIWIIMIVNASLSLFTLISVYSQGTDLVGITFYGLTAVNLVFVINLLLPVLLIVGIYKRFKYIWAAVVVYFVFIAVDALLSIPLIGSKVTMLAEQQGESIEKLGEELFYKIAHFTLLIMIIMGAAFNMAIAIIFFIKRKYFINPPVAMDLNKDMQLPS